MHHSSQRPKSLDDVATRAESLESWGLALGDFLDEIGYRRANGMAITLCVHVPPKLLRREFAGGEVADAFAAALAEHLAAESNEGPAPAWTKEPARFLETPWYPDESPRIRDYLAATAPPAFRNHGIFIDLGSLARV